MMIIFLDNNGVFYKNPTYRALQKQCEDEFQRKRSIQSDFLSILTLFLGHKIA